MGLVLMSAHQATAWKTPDADIELFATGLYRARGASAKEMAMARARTYKEVGDREGHRVWRAVAYRVDKAHKRAN